MRLSFHGGAKEVTGACYLLETAGAHILIDCGLFQGCGDCPDANFGDFKFDPASVQALIVTHAHIDHVGRIPKLVRDGFSGKIYSTEATRDLARLLLEDALSLAERQNHNGNRRQLYGARDLEHAFSLWETVGYGEKTVIEDVVFHFVNAGHILGSAMAELEVEGKRVLFTGDVGNDPSVLLPSPERVRGLQYLVIESTYGNRTHEPPEERVLKLERAIEDIAARRGTLMIPAFAAERTQEMLYLLNEMLHFKRIPDIPVFVDAPLAIRITDVYERYVGAYREEIQTLYAKHPHLFRFKKLKFTPAVDESKMINGVPAPKVVIAGSGMMNGGRILHHARRYLPDPNSILMMTGYQAAGSLGRRLIDGAKTVRMFGEEIFVEAEIRKINGFSAHADNPRLFAFVERNRETLERVFVVQGEEAQAMHFMQETKDRLGVRADVPALYESFEI